MILNYPRMRSSCPNTRRHLPRWLSLVLVVLSLGPLLPGANAYPLTERERARLEAAMPRTLARLEARKPVSIVIIGDSVSRVFTPDANANQTIHGMHAQFAMRLANEFFYPGGVRVIHPLGDEPVKLGGTHGAEIFLENLALPGHTAVDGLQRITTDAFLNDPDLVMICYGINDSVRDFDLGTYEKALGECIDACRARGVDVILLGPNLTRQSPGPTGWGLGRAHVTKARELAEAKKVFFVDLGKGLSQRGGIPYQADAAEAAIETMSERLATIFDFGPGATVEDWLHPNFATHTQMGDMIFDALMAGVKFEDPLKFTAQAYYGKTGHIVVDLTVTNTSETRRRGHFGALTIRRELSPTEVYHSFDLPPGQGKAFQIRYNKVPAPGQETEGAPTEFFRMDPSDPRLRLSYLVAEEEHSGIVDVVTPLLPVGISWNTTLLTNVTDQLQIEWTMENKSPKLANVRYQLELGAQKTDGQVALDQGQSSRRFAKFPFNPRPDVVREKIPVKLTLDVDGRTYEFSREIEATRDLFLTERIALSNQDEYIASGIGTGTLSAGESGMTLRADADENALYLTFDFENLKLQPVAQGASLIADLSIDGRPADEVRTFGCVDRVRVTTGSEPGYGETSHIRPGFFGNGYDKTIDPRYIISTVEQRTDLSQRFTVKIPRKYLFRHGWEIGNPDSVLGLNANLSLAAIDPQTGTIGYPASHRYLLASAVGYYFRDARSLITLRLTPNKIPMWSVRVY